MLGEQTKGRTEFYNVPLGVIVAMSDSQVGTAFYRRIKHRATYVEQNLLEWLCDQRIRLTSVLAAGRFFGRNNSAGGCVTT